MHNKILIIEDEYAIADLLAYSLEKDGFQVVTAYDGQSGIKCFEENKPELILLDLMLPDMDGFDVCRKIRSAVNTPLMILTARTDIADKVAGLELGADDYITKPFDIREVTARIRASLRRVESMSESDSLKDKVSIGYDIQIYRNQHYVVKGDVKLVLTPKEYDLLLFFAENKGIAFTRAKLLDCVWGYDYEGDSRTVDIHVQRLRKKLEDLEGSIIQTVFGVGYRMAKS